MHDDVLAEDMIASGKAIEAKQWLLGKFGERRIGEIQTKPDSSPLYRLHEDIMERSWVSDIRIDDSGNEYANLVIFELPKRGRKAIFTGLNIRFALSNLPKIEDMGQKYVICPEPSAQQVEQALKRIREL